jgi:hypothetical protein
MLHMERDILELADQAGAQGPVLPAPPIIAGIVDRLLERGLLEVAGREGRVAITDAGRAVLLGGERRSEPRC